MLLQSRTLKTFDLLRSDKQAFLEKRMEEVQKTAKPTRPRRKKHERAREARASEHGLTNIVLSPGFIDDDEPEPTALRVEQLPEPSFEKDD